MSHCNYLLSVGCGNLTKVSICDPCLFDSDHCLVAGNYQAEPPARNASYLNERRWFPLKVSKWGPLSWCEALIEELHSQIPAATRASRRAVHPWISEATWKLVDERASAWRSPTLPYNQTEYRRLSRMIKWSFAEDQRARVQTAGTFIESKLAAGDLRGAWGAAKVWYNHAGDPLREEIPANWDNWDILVDLIQHMYEMGEVPDHLAWSICVLLPKQGGGVRGISLIEVIWKIISSIIRGRINGNVHFHDSLHGCIPQWETGTAIIEAKLFQQLAHISGAPAFEVFIDLQKAFDSIDCEWTLDILSGYGLGTKACTLLWNYWMKQRVVARQSDYYGDPFSPTQGITQGDPSSLTIFNVLVDTVV